MPVKAGHREPMRIERPSAARCLSAGRRCFRPERISPTKELKFELYRQDGMWNHRARLTRHPAAGRLALQEVECSCLSRG